MEFLTGFLVSCIILGSVFLSSYLKRFKGTLPPGPTGLTVYKAFFKAVRDQTTYKLFVKWARDFGEIFFLQIPGQNILVLNSAEAMRQIFNGPNRNITNDRPPNFIGKYFFKGCGISFSPASKLWKQLRQIFHSSIKLHENGGAKIGSILTSHLETVMSKLETMGPGEQVPVTDIASNYLLTVLHILITGELPRPDSPNLELMAELDHYINLTLALDQEVVLTTFPFLRFLPNSYGTRWRRMVELKQKIGHIFYEHYFENFKNSEQGVINTYIKKMREEGSLVTEDQVRVVTMEIIAASFVPTLSTIKSILLICLHKPEIQERLHQEIVDVLGDSTPSLKDRHRMPYFEAVFLENMRCSSQLPIGFPHVASETFEYKGFTIPENTVILPNLFHVDHDDQLWDSPGDFRPERFLQEDGSLVDPLSDTRRQFVSFGIGKRSCPGEGFAKSRIFIFIVTLFQKYEIVPSGAEPLPSHNPYDWEPGLIIMPKRFNCKLIPRKPTKSQ